MNNTAVPTIMDPADGLVCAACGRGHHGEPCPHVPGALTRPAGGDKLGYIATWWDHGCGVRHRRADTPEEAMAAAQAAIDATDARGVASYASDTAGDPTAGPFRSSADTVTVHLCD